MRIKAPLPAKSGFPGDPDPEPTPLPALPPPKDDGQSPRLLTPHEKVQRLKTLVQGGLYKRAVVAAVGEDYTDPMLWGVVTDIKSQAQWPIIVQWLRGKTTITDGKDLVVIYRGMSQTDIKNFMEMTTRAAH